MTAGGSEITENVLAHHSDQLIIRQKQVAAGLSGGAIPFLRPQIDLISLSKPFSLFPALPPRGGNAPLKGLTRLRADLAPSVRSQAQKQR